MIPVIHDVLKTIETPAYVIDETALFHNLQILKEVREQAGCRILLAQKAFSAFALYPVMAEYLDGTTASGLYEARLGRECFPGEVHTFCPAYKEAEMEELLHISDHLVFNSVAQLKKYKDICAGKSIGLRINPECSTQETAIYDPCAPGSRLGVTLANFDPEVVQDIDGLHFHTLCEQGADALEKTLAVVEEKFGEYLHQVKWVNFGGGHHITKEDYKAYLVEKMNSAKTPNYGTSMQIRLQ